MSSFNLEAMMREIAASGAAAGGDPLDGFDPARMGPELKEVWAKLDEMAARSPEEYNAYVRRQFEEEAARRTGRRMIQPLPGAVLRGKITDRTKPKRPADMPTHLPQPTVPFDVAPGHLVHVNLCYHTALTPPTMLADGRSVLEVEKTLAAAAAASKGGKKKAAAAAVIPLEDLLNMDVPIAVGSVRAVKGSGRTEWALDVLMHKWAIRTLEDRGADFRPYMLQFIAATIADETGLACGELQLREPASGGEPVPRYIAGEKPAAGVPRVHGVGVGGDGGGDEEVPCMFDLGPIAERAAPAPASSGGGRGGAPSGSGKGASASTSASAALTSDAAAASAPLPSATADVMASPHALLRTMAVSAATDAATTPAAMHTGAAAPATSSARGSTSTGSSSSSIAPPAVASPVATARAAAGAHSAAASAASGGADLRPVTSVRTAAAAPASASDAAAAATPTAPSAPLPPWLRAVTVSRPRPGDGDPAPASFSVDLSFNGDAIDVKALDMADVDVFVDNNAVTGVGACRITLAHDCKALRAGVGSGAPVHVSLPAAVCVDATTAKLQRSRGQLSIRCRVS